MTPSSYLTQNSGRLVSFLQKLIRLRTVNPPGENYGEITQLLADTLAGLGMKVRRIAIPRSLQKKTQPNQLDYPRYNIIAFWDAGAKKTVHLNAHYDVVPVSGEWRHKSPFNPIVEKGWMYGRGTADMKGAIASIVYSLKALRATGTKPLCNVEVSFVADEETDSVLGANWVVDHGGLKADFAVVGEGGERNAICCGHNGVVWLNIIVHGKAAHGSMPEKGINALEKMSSLVLALGDYKKILTKRTFRAPDGTALHPTLNLGGVFAPGEGGKINTVPGLASFTIDRRVLPTENIATAEKELRAQVTRAAASIPACRITIEKISDNYSCFSPPDHSFFHAMKASVSRVRKQPTRAMVSTGFNDMHFFVQHLKIPTLGYGPGGVDFHAIDERAPVKELVNSAKIYADLLTTFAG